MKRMMLLSLRCWVVLVVMMPVFSLSACQDPAPGRGSVNADRQPVDTAIAEKKGNLPTAIKDDIHTAVLKNDIDAVKQYIAAGSDLNVKEAYGGSTALITAALFGRPEIAGLLIEAGASLDIQNNDGSTALITAAFFCRPEIVKMLLDKNASKAIRNNYGQNAYETVAGPFIDVKPVYDMLGKALAPMGLKLDYSYIQQTRPVIASMLR